MSTALALSVLDRFTDAFNRQDPGGMDATLLFPHMFLGDKRGGMDAARKFAWKFLLGADGIRLVVLTLYQKAGGAGRGATGPCSGRI